MQEELALDMQLENNGGDEPRTQLHPAPITLEIEARQNLGSLLSNILYPEENGSEFQGISSLLTSAAKIELNKLPGCHFSPHLRLEVFNAADDKIDELKGPLQRNYLCACHSGSTIPITRNEEEVLSFTYDSVVCTPVCGTQSTAVEVYLPARGEPIGRIEYMSRNFTEREVIITNYITNETLTARPVVLNSRLPEMQIKNSSGNLVAVAGVTHASTYRGTTTYRGIKVLFPTIGISAATKSLLMVFGTLLQMDHQQNNVRWSLFGLLISAIVISAIVILSILNVI